MTFEEVALMLWARQNHLEIVSVRFVPKEEGHGAEKGYDVADTYCAAIACFDAQKIKTENGKHNAYPYGFGRLFL